MNTRTLRITALLLISGIGTSHLFAAEIAAVRARGDAATEEVAYATPTVVKAWLDEGQSVTLLDVRQADEFAAGHIANAINVHYDQVAALVDQLPHEQPIVVYCIHSAHRAPMAAKTLRGLGFNNVSILEGGIVAWQAEGLPIRASDLAHMPTILPKTERCDNLETISKSQEQLAASRRYP